jgi:uncharacterized integral membrane protein (TIGR00697 family)
MINLCATMQIAFNPKWIKFMQINMATAGKVEVKSDILWFLTLTYTMVMILANWFDPRLITIFGYPTDAGTLIFPFTFLLADLITEVYGYKHARRAIWCGFLFNLVFFLYGQIVVHMPSPDYPTNNQMFDTLHTTNLKVILASSLSYLASEPLNSFTMAKLKIKMNGRHLWLRFLVSTILASGADSLIFGVMAFYGTMTNANLIALVITMWLVKMGIEITGIPASIMLTNTLKRVEKLEIYDKNTDFSLFDLNTNYIEEDNEYTRAANS